MATFTPPLSRSLSLSPREQPSDLDRWLLLPLPCPDHFLLLLESNTVIWTGPSLASANSVVVPRFAYFRGGRQHARHRFVLAAALARTPLSAPPVPSQPFRGRSDQVPTCCSSVNLGWQVRVGGDWCGATKMEVMMCGDSMMQHSVPSADFGCEPTRSAAPRTLGSHKGPARARARVIGQGLRCLSPCGSDRDLTSADALACAGRRRVVNHLSGICHRTHRTMPAGSAS